MTFLAALRENDRLIWLSESGVWLPRSAFEARGSEHKLRQFRYEELARGVAEDWANLVVGMEAHVEVSGA